MNKKQWLGVCIIFLGIAVTGFATHAMGQINRAKEGAGLLTKPFSGNPIGNTVTAKVQAETDRYDSAVRILLVGGVATILVGCGAVYFLRR